MAGLGTKLEEDCSLPESPVMSFLPYSISEPHSNNTARFTKVTWEGLVTGSRTVCQVGRWAGLESQAPAM